jgi:hypothetical protein
MSVATHIDAKATQLTLDVEASMRSHPAGRARKDGAA